MHFGETAKFATADSFLARQSLSNASVFTLYSQVTPGPSAWTAPPRITSAGFSGTCHLPVWNDLKSLNV